MKKKYGILHGATSHGSFAMTCRAAGGLVAWQYLTLTLMHRSGGSDSRGNMETLAKCYGNINNCLSELSLSSDPWWQMTWDISSWSEHFQMLLGRLSKNNSKPQLHLFNWTCWYEALTGSAENWNMAISSVKCLNTVWIKNCFGRMGSELSYQIWVFVRENLQYEKANSCCD